MNSVHLLEMQYFGVFRYAAERNLILYKEPEDVSIEAHIFAYHFEAPYLYVYGVTGYSKINVAPLGKIEKVPNLAYYERIYPDTIGPISSSFEYLQESLGAQLRIKSSLKRVSADDRAIYEGL